MRLHCSLFVLPAFGAFSAARAGTAPDHAN